MKQKVVIVGQGYTGRLSIVRSVAAIDCEIIIIALLPRGFKDHNNISRPLDSYSKYVCKTLYSENYNDEMLVDILLTQCASRGQKTFIFPDNDFSAAAIDKHRDKLEEFFYCPHINHQQGAVEKWMNKVRQKELAKQLGLNVVNSSLIKVENQSFTIPENINYPCFVKPLRSIVGGKSGLNRCDNKEMLDKHIKKFLTENKLNFRDVDFLVEDFKQINREYATLGFSDGNEVVIPGVLELLHIGHGSHFGVAVQGRVFPTDGYESILEKFKTFVKKIGFVGIFDIDFFECGGEFYFCELNLRFGGSGYAFTKLGVNLPVLMIKSFLGESIEGINKKINKEAKYFNERMAIDDWYGGYLSTSDFLKMRSESDIKFVEDNEDSAPQKKLEKEFRIKQIKKTVKKLIGKQ